MKPGFHRAVPAAAPYRRPRRTGGGAAMKPGIHRASCSDNSGTTSRPERAQHSNAGTTLRSPTINFCCVPHQPRHPGTAQQHRRPGDAEMAQRTDVAIQMIPFRAGGHSAPGGSFTILRFGEIDLPDVVYLEQLASALYLNKPEAVTSHLSAMNRLAAEALTPAETMQFLMQLLK